MSLLLGINVGGYFSQCSHRQDHYEEFICKEDIAEIASRGFDHVRLPVDYELLEREDGAARESGYRLLDRFISWAGEYGLDVILDLHSTYGYNFDHAGTAGRNRLFHESALRTRFVALWETLAARYGENPSIAFELLNEVVETEYAGHWNSLIAQTVKAIRRIAPRTPIIYGGMQWNSAQTLPLLLPPADANTIFTFHFYEPLVFTHQGAYWVPELSGIPPVAWPQSLEHYRERSLVLGSRGDAVMKATAQNMGSDFIEEFIEPAISFARRQGVPLYCGEYGVIDVAPIEDSLRWYRDVHKVFAKHGIGHAAWNFRGKDFGLFDEHYDLLREALFPRRERSVEFIQEGI